jgi:hypothetical protein
MWFFPLPPSSLRFRNVCLFHFCDYFPCHPLFCCLLRLSLELQTAGIRYRLQLVVNYIAPNSMVSVIKFLVIFLLHVFSTYLPSSCRSYFTHILHQCFQICCVYSSASFSYSSPIVDFTICCETYA